MRIFMPADAPGLNLCKVIMSAVALGYPLPTLLNWGGEFNRPEWHFSGSHIAKLESLSAVIEELLDNGGDDAHEDDIALMIDAYDLWFQLPPSVLIQRFEQLNAEADGRNRKRWEDASATSGWADFPIPPPRQEIIVTSAKDCSPGPDSGSDPHYDLWPESPMPRDLYGEGTDELTPPTWDAARKYRKIRPRCVNSGVIMGTMGALRRALRRCREKVDMTARNGRQLWSDQALIGEVIGDQEAWRHWVTELAQTWDGTGARHSLSRRDAFVDTVAQAAMDGTHFEFGIGLDYNFSTIPPTCSAEEDGYFVQLNDTDAVELLSEHAGVPDDIRVRGVPPELQNSGLNADPFSDIDWSREQLYTDFYFGTTLVGIHHNAWIDGLKSRRLKNWWSRMWYYPRLRGLVKRSLQSGADAARELHQTYPKTPNGKEVVYKAPKGAEVTVFRPGKDESPAEFAPISWDGVCQNGPSPWHENLFGDDEGPLEYGG